VRACTIALTHIHGPVEKAIPKRSKDPENPVQFNGELAFMFENVSSVISRSKIPVDNLEWRDIEYATYWKD
jgi:homogentisate 1,2-dioxygenase